MQETQKKDYSACWRTLLTNDDRLSVCTAIPIEILP